MTRDRRTDQKSISDDIKKVLNSKQLTAFHQSICFGWRIGFVRKPLFQDPLIVVYNNEYDLIGVLDPDGHINTEVALDIRVNETPEKPIESGALTERRKGRKFTRGNLDMLLNPKQLSTLERIEKFGWQLNFVREPFLQQPIAVIISPKGDKLATLEVDGRIKVLPGLNVRKEDMSEQRGSVPVETLPAEKEVV